MALIKPRAIVAAASFLVIAAVGLVVLLKPQAPNPKPPVAMKPDHPTLEKERHALFGTFTSAESWLVLADSYIRSGDTSGAVAAIRAALRAHPDDAVLWTGLGSALVDQHRSFTPDAAAAFEKAMQLAPHSPGPPYFRGLALQRTGDLAGARAQWKQMLDSAPAKASWRDLVERSIAAISPDSGSQRSR